MIMNTDDEINDKSVIPLGPKGVELNNIDAAFRFARCYRQSGLAPKSFTNDQQLVIAWAKGAELGLSPLQATDGMSIINNRVGIMGDLALAMVEASGLLEDKKVSYTGEGPTLECQLMLKRKGREEKFYTYSVKEAKEANIYDRNPTWKGYPKRMTYYRALGFGLRDEFAEILKGVKTVEELQDYPTDEIAREATRDAEILAKEKFKKSNVKFVEAKPVDRPTAAEEVEPAFEEDKAKEAPMFSRKLETEYQQPPTPMTAAKPAKQEEPDDIDLGPVPPVQQAPASASSPSASAGVPPEAWRDYIIKSFPPKIKQFHQQKIGDLSPQLLEAIANQWLPAIRKEWDDASEAQRQDAVQFESAIAHSKVAKPW